MTDFDFVKKGGCSHFCLHIYVLQTVISRHFVLQKDICNTQYKNI